jgi:hypothetical protein
MDPISLLMAAQAAVSAIRKGCEMLSEGKAEIQKLKKTVEGGVADARAIYNEVSGLWSWIQGLFGVKPAKPTPAPQAAPVADGALINEATKPKKAKRAPEPEMSYEEYKAKAVHDIFDNLKIFFEALRGLRAHCHELEQVSKTTDRVADSAIDRIEIEWQIKEMQGQVSHAMIYGTPESLGLGDLYRQFLKMYELILEEQEVARMIAAKKERDKTWQRELLRNHQIDRAVVSALVLVVVLWMWGFLLSLGWLVRTHTGL